MSKSTIVSVIPFPLIETKPGIYPGKFEIAAAKPNDFEILVIGNSVYHVEIDENRTITVPAVSEQIAESIIEDYVIAQIAFSREEDVAPGIFWVPGENTKKDIITKFNEKLEYAKQRQIRWFRELVKIADDDWEKTRKHRAISDMQRYAAKSLELDRPWIIPISINDENSLMTKCVACRSIVSTDAIVCSNCKCILQPEKYKNLQFAEK